MQDAYDADVVVVVTCAGDEADTEEHSAGLDTLPAIWASEKFSHRYLGSLKIR